MSSSASEELRLERQKLSEMLQTHASYHSTTLTPVGSTSTSSTPTPTTRPPKNPEISISGPQMAEMAPLSERELELTRVVESLVERLIRSETERENLEISLSRVTGDLEEGERARRTLREVLAADLQAAKRWRGKEKERAFLEGITLENGVLEKISPPPNFADPPGSFPLHFRTELRYIFFFLPFLYK